MPASIPLPHFHVTIDHPPLRTGEVHLWLASLDGWPAGEHLPLITDEWLRAESFHQALDRQRFVASRAALRLILGGYVPAPAGSLRFLRNHYGKPTLAGSLLRFNLSHSEGLMLLAITHGREVGVDLEAVRENVSFEMLAEHYFAPEEQWQLRTTPVPERRAKFFELWTRAEAQIKARGIGLGEPVRRDDAESFAVHSFEPAPGFAAALAVEGGDFDLSCWRWPT